MNFLNKSNVSTREVVEELEKTKHKLQKSQTRLINLSAAYKALQEEKKTLEATISAISSQGSNMSAMNYVADNVNFQNNTMCIENWQTISRDAFQSYIGSKVGSLFEPCCQWWRK